MRAQRSVIWQFEKPGDVATLLRFFSTRAPLRSQPHAVRLIRSITELVVHRDLVRLSVRVEAVLLCTPYDLRRDGEYVRVVRIVDAILLFACEC